MEEIVRGYEYEKGRFVIIDESDFARIPAETSRTIAIVDFVRDDEVDPLYYDRSYYLAPGETGEKAFQLLMQSMAEAGLVAIIRIVLRSRQALGVLRVYRDSLALETMFYPDEVRPTSELPQWNRDQKVQESELEMARQLISNLTAPFSPDKYTDEYRAALLEIINGKIKGEEVFIASSPEKGEVIDLAEALKASVEATRRGASKKAAGDKKKTGAVPVELTALWDFFTALQPMEPLSKRALQQPQLHISGQMGRCSWPCWSSDG